MALHGAHVGAYVIRFDGMYVCMCVCGFCMIVCVCVMFAAFVCGFAMRRSFAVFAVAAGLALGHVL